MNIHILEMPIDFGASRHGSDMGPSAIRLAGIKQRLESLGHHTERYFSPMQISPQEYEEIGNPKAKYLKAIVQANNQLASEVEKAVLSDGFPLILGGDHSIALGSVAGLSAAYQKKGLKLGVLYVDAHGDFNTAETSPSGNIHGECMSANCGYGLPELTNLYFEGRKLDPKNLCYVGLRSIDPEERVLMKEAGVTAYTMSDIDRLGICEVVKQILRFFRKRVDAIHVSFDMDCLDPMYAPGTGYQLPAGMTNREALLLMEEMAGCGLVRSAEIVEVNPVLDVRNQTAAFAVDLVARLLGETIY
ncbi:arginase [Treponema sp.]|uniref:arginase n=1 Tax=Treponema sp. TaxID=166 RepID=UPI0038908FE2